MARAIGRGNFYNLPQILKTDFHTRNSEEGVRFILKSCEPVWRYGRCDMGNREKG